MIAQQVKLNDQLSIAQACQALDVSRIDYYRRSIGLIEADSDLELREKIQQIALEMSAYGYPRITAELGRRGEAVNTSGCCD